MSNLYEFGYLHPTQRHQLHLWWSYCYFDFNMLWCTFKSLSISTNFHDCGSHDGNLIAVEPKLERVTDEKGCHDHSHRQSYRHLSPLKMDMWLLFIIIIKLKVDLLTCLLFKAAKALPLFLMIFKMFMLKKVKVAKGRRFSSTVPNKTIFRMMVTEFQRKRAWNYNFHCED